MKILVVDDEQAVRDSLRRSLAFNGYTVALAEDGVQALDMIRREQPHLVILDVMMPRMDGVEVCRTLRSEGDKRPVLVLTARDSVSDRVGGLDAGADDYLAKPFALEELLARVRSLIRRSAAEPFTANNVETELTFEDLVLNLKTRDVSRGGRPISLTRTEFALLNMFMRHPRKVLSRADILEEVWGNEAPSSGNALEVFIGYLRKKTEMSEGTEARSRLIHTVRGVGYVLRQTVS
ncbi:response regulator transcription factor [Corynebacterium pacaense]|uniref:response regulator transcription factor n=1 Tax=Corynebacterium pacaense TaxID=1816684 RepID=UPI0009BB3CC1|nr:response regulator transcription factor [Corynebacterium pacaense]